MFSECITDDSGEKIWTKRIHKGRFAGPACKPNTIEKMVHVPLRDDDVILCSYPKSGTHWLVENIRCLLMGKIYKDESETDKTMMEMHEHGYFDNHPSPRILNTHVYFDDLPSDILKGKAKVVLVYRNPKDIAVSLYHHYSRMTSFQYNGRFSNFMNAFVQGRFINCCFDYWKMWEEAFAKNPQVPYILVRYEDLHVDPIGERRKLASFLGKDYDDDFLQAVVEATSIDAMKTTKGQKSIKGQKGDLLFYRKGKVGDWKNHFTVSESEWFHSVAEKEMGDSKLFKFVYSID